MESVDWVSEERIEEKFTDFKPPFDDLEATTEASRCIQCYQAPCVHACPTEINIPKFIGRIASGNTLGAAKTILDSNILGHSCALSCPTEVLCEGACVYHDLNKEPIKIGKLQRYAVEKAYAEGAKFYFPKEATGKKIALIGAGPASLACAHELRKEGHEAVIFEKSQFPGGLNTSGIAPYKMKAGTSLAEIEQVASIGVQFEFEKELGQNLNLNSLLQDYDAVFLGMGLGPDSRLSIPGIDHPRIQGAVDFISKIKTTPASDLKWLRTVQTALVIGAGNTALDACRELKYLEIPQVVVSYRRGEKEMSGYRHEFQLARQAGVDFQFYTLPLEFKSLGTDRVQVKLQKSLVPSMIGDGVLFLDANLVLLATGQSKLERLLVETEGLKFEKGCLQTDPKTGKTGHPKIYAGGDLANGGKEVVNAVAEGKCAAQAIHKELQNG